ncbi:MAG TPA: UDP-N-acetylglucosamine 1-carboxyvinyltransferase [bacterium]|nr:UDP-N-acetylglucosamine 1-carboxyvinyltransferase [bacterium]
MQKISVKGGKTLKGTVEISGSKNATLPVMTAALLAESTSVIHNVPYLNDIKTMAEVLRTLGAAALLEDHRLHIDPKGFNKFEAPYELVKTMRASIYSLGACLARLGEAKVSLPGGCAIGARPIDLHLKGVEQLGAKITIEHGYIHAKASKLKGTTIYLAGPHGPSVGATVNVLMAATAAEGTTVIESASTEPEVGDLVNFLKAMGAHIEGGGTSRLVIEGKKTLKGIDYSVIPDRVEAGTFMVAAAITQGDVLLKKAEASHLTAVSEKLRQIGVKVEESAEGLRVKGGGTYKPADVWILPYPGFPTDMQAQVMALLAVVPGISVITETIWENRFMHVFELNRMGADINIDRSHAVVKGVKQLMGAPVMASDLRASAALILAGLVADGETLVQRIYHLDRGYEKIEQKLSALGAEIKRID